MDETPEAEPREEDLPDKPPIPDVEEDHEVPGEEEVPEEDFQSPIEAATSETTDDREEE
jgi:hypothetical protein